MNAHYKKFIRKKYILVGHAHHILNTNRLSWDGIYLLEALISNAWQTWNTFCRDLLLKSCQGCIGRSGIKYIGRDGDNSIEFIAGEYKIYKNGNAKASKKIKKINNIRNHPTWGDCNCILNVINGLNPINKAT